MALAVRPAQIPRMSLADFLLLEKHAVGRSEFHAGHVYAMAGGTIEHAMAMGAWTRELGNLAKGSNCLLLGADMGIWIPSEQSFVYPDVSLVCGKPRFHDRDRRLLLNPKLIVDVLSPSTRDYDLSTKFNLYKQTPDFEEYIAADPRAVEVFYRSRDTRGRWHTKKFTDPQARIPLKSLGQELALADIYGPA